MVMSKWGCGVLAIGWFMLGVVSGGPVLAAEHLAPELEALRPFIGKTWRGVLSEPGKPEQVDISRWERALNGTAIKMVHSVNNGVYGGETVLFFDKTQQVLSYYYFTTAGFYTHGTMTFNPATGELVAEERVENNAQGISKVRSTSVLKADRLQVSSQYLKNGSWVAGHQAIYTEAPTAQVIFK